MCAGGKNPWSFFVQTASQGAWEGGRKGSLGYGDERLGITLTHSQRNAGHTYIHSHTHTHTPILFSLSPDNRG